MAQYITELFDDSIILSSISSMSSLFIFSQLFENNNNSNNNNYNFKFFFYKILIESIFENKNYKKVYSI
jgi:hypothetical protein